MRVDESPLEAAVSGYAVTAEHALHEGPVAGVGIGRIGDVVESGHEVLGSNREDEYRGGDAGHSPDRPTGYGATP